MTMSETTTGPRTYDLLIEHGLPESEVRAHEARERAESDQFAESRAWAREHLQQCGIDPDDTVAVRQAFDLIRGAHLEWLRGQGGDVDAEAYGSLVYAIRALYGWVHWPDDWPAPYVYLRTQPLRNAIPRMRADV